MLSSVTALRHYRAASNGRTRPQIIGGAREDGSEVELFAKFSAGCDRGNSTLATEAVAAMLAADLTVPVAEPCVVEFGNSFADIISEPAEKELVRRSQSPAFGSLKLPPGFTAWNRERIVSESMVDDACSIYIFDALTANVDRKPDNPNCLSSGDSIGVFDHDIALVTKDVLFWTPPWKRGGVDFLAGSAAHIFFDALARNPVAISSLECHRTRWGALTETRLDEYFSTLPSVWASANAVDDIFGYLKDLIENIDAAIDEVKRILS